MISAKRRNAINAYMKCFNKKRALLEAGYSMSMACTRANDIFHAPDVMAEIARRQNIAAHRSDVTLDWIVQRLKMIAEANIGDILDVYSDGSAKINFSRLTPAIKYALNKFSVTEKKDGRGKNAGVVVDSRVGLSDQLKALELLVRHLGLSKEKTSLEVSGEVSLVEQLHRGRSRAGMGGQEE